MKLQRIAFFFPFLATLAASGCASMQSASHDAYLPSTQDTVVRGHLPAGRKPVLTVKSGQVVRIVTVSHQGITGVDPVTFFGRAGIAANEVLPDAIEIFNNVQLPKGGSVHVVTGPIYIEDAEPGDMLEVRILQLDFRVPYGVNNSNKGSGVLPGVHTGPYPKIIKFDLARRVALFAPSIEVPLVPFMGIMAVMPPENALPSTRPPRHLRRQPGFQSTDHRRHSLSAGPSARRALLYG